MTRGEYGDWGGKTTRARFGCPLVCQGRDLACKNSAFRSLQLIIVVEAVHIYIYHISQFGGCPMSLFLWAWLQECFNFVILLGGFSCIGGLWWEWAKKERSQCWSIGTSSKAFCSGKSCKIVLKGRKKIQCFGITSRTKL